MQIYQKRCAVLSSVVRQTISPKIRCYAISLRCDRHPNRRAKLLSDPTLEGSTVGAIQKAKESNKNSQEAIIETVDRIETI
jgi:hypothetical protein